MVHRGRGASKLPGGQGINRSAVRDAVDAVQKANALPLVVVGVERNLPFYREVTRQGAWIIGMLAGNHEQGPQSTLGKLVWPVFDAGATLGRAEALVQLDKAVGGRCRALLVEKELKCPADLSHKGDRLLPYTGKGPRRWMMPWTRSSNG